MCCLRSTCWRQEGFWARPEEYCYFGTRRWAPRGWNVVGGWSETCRKYFDSTWYGFRESISLARREDVGGERCRSISRRRRLGQAQVGCSDSELHRPRSPDMAENEEASEISQMTAESRAEDPVWRWWNRQWWEGHRWFGLGRMHEHTEEHERWVHHGGARRRRLSRWLRSGEGSQWGTPRAKEFAKEQGLARSGTSMLRFSGSRIRFENGAPRWRKLQEVIILRTFLRSIGLELKFQKPAEGLDSLWRTAGATSWTLLRWVSSEQSLLCNTCSSQQPVAGAEGSVGSTINNARNSTADRAGTEAPTPRLWHLWWEQGPKGLLSEVAAKCTVRPLLLRRVPRWGTTSRHFSTWTQLTSSTSKNTSSFPECVAIQQCLYFSSLLFRMNNHWRSSALLWAVSVLISATFDDWTCVLQLAQETDRLSSHHSPSGVRSEESSAQRGITRVDVNFRDGGFAGESSAAICRERSNKKDIACQDFSLKKMYTNVFK